MHPLAGYRRRFVEILKTAGQDSPRRANRNRLALSRLWMELVRLHVLRRIPRGVFSDHRSRSRVPCKHLIPTCASTTTGKSTQFLGVSKRNVAELRATGNLPFVRLGRKRVGVRHADLAQIPETQFVSESGRRCSMTQEYCLFQHASGRWVELSFDSPPEEVIESGEPIAPKRAPRVPGGRSAKERKRMQRQRDSGAKSFAN